MKHAEISGLPHWNVPVRIETHRSGPFVFQAGIDMDRLTSLLQRVEDAHKRFASVPVLPDIANQLEQEVIVSSVFGTNTIEGGTFTEEETAEVLQLPQNTRDETELRVTNIRRAYDTAEAFAQYWCDSKPMGMSLPIEEAMFKDLHREITQGLSHPHNIPGEYRDNHKGFHTRVGDDEHGGVYTPPKCKDDIQLLMHTFIEWANSDAIIALPPPVRAPLIHYYFERIHPFWDGNGRVGRVAEAMVLKAAGYSYAPFALSRYYLDHLDEYFSIFNRARKTEKTSPYPNMVFAEFFLQALLEVFNRLHDRVNRMIGALLYANMVRDMLERKTINQRQYTLITQLLHTRETQKIPDIQNQRWYRNLYHNRTPRTASRDLKGLIELRLIRIEEDQVIRLLIP